MICFKCQEFSGLDKKRLLREAAKKVLEAIIKGHAIRNPAKLTNFTLLTFSDLKAHKYLYWMAQPALSMNSSAYHGVIQPLDAQLYSKSSPSSGLFVIYNYLIQVLFAAPDQTITSESLTAEQVAQSAASLQEDGIDPADLLPGEPDKINLLQARTSPPSFPSIFALKVSTQ